MPSGFIAHLRDNYYSAMDNIFRNLTEWLLGLKLLKITLKFFFSSIQKIRKSISNSFECCSKLKII